MSPAQRRYVLGEQGIGAAIFNALINAAFAWAMFRRLDFVPIDGERSITGDTIGTGLLLPLITAFVVTALARREVRIGHLGPLDLPPALAWLPARTWLRGLVLGLITVLVLSIPTVAMLHALGVTGMTFWRFILFKATFAAFAGLVVTPVVALYALATAPVPVAAVRRDSAA